MQTTKTKTKTITQAITPGFSTVLVLLSVLPVTSELSVSKLYKEFNFVTSEAVFTLHISDLAITMKTGSLSLLSLKAEEEIEIISPDKLRIDIEVKKPSSAPGFTLVITCLAISLLIKRKKIITQLK